MLFSMLFIAVIFSRYASGGEVKVAAGGEAVFRPGKPLLSPTNSITWKYRSNNIVVVIEWDEDGFATPNDRFKGITTLDEKTGVMTIKPVNFSHGGEYFFEVNSKDQGERFTLTVANRVQKPEIKIEKSNVNSDVAYLNCDYSETIIWRNSAGETLTGSITPKGQSITVRKNGAPGNYYTCSLRNDVSEETSDRVYEKDLFEDPSGGMSSGLIAFIVIVLIILLLALAVVVGYKLNDDFRKFVRRLPCFPCFKAEGQEGDPVKPAGYKKAPTSDDVEANNHGKKNQVEEEMINPAKEQGGDPVKQTDIQPAQATDDVEANNHGKKNQVEEEMINPVEAEALKVNAADTTGNSTGTTGDKSAEENKEAA